MLRASHICRLGATVQVLMLLGGATMALADDTVDIPLDLQAIPTVDDDDTWADVTQKRPLRWELATGVRRETMAGPLDTLVRDSKAVGFASLALNADFVLAPGLSLQGRAILYTEGGATDLFLQRIKLEYAPASTPIRLSLGKDYLAWSFTDLAHVMDPSPLETAQIDATDTGDDYAHPYAMVQYASGPHQLSFAAMSEGHKFDDLSEDGHLYALRYETQIGSSNLSVQALHRDNSETEVGVGINTTLGSAVVSFEASVASRQRLPFASPRAGGGVLEQASEDKATFQAVAAGRFPLSTRWQAEAAYLYNGHGYDDAQWDTFRSVEDAVLTSLRGGNFQYAGFLGDAQTAHADQYLRRNYVALALSSLEDLGKWSVTVGGLHGLDDGSTFGFATASRPLGEIGRLDMSISGGFGGFDTEFARRPQEFSVQMVWGF